MGDDESPSSMVEVLERGDDRGDARRGVVARTLPSADARGEEIGEVGEDVFGGPSSGIETKVSSARDTLEM